MRRLSDAGMWLGWVTGGHVIHPRLNKQGQLPQSDLYIIYSMSNSPYQQWQADLLDFSAHQVGQPGVIVRLCSQEAGVSDSEVRPSIPGYTFVTPCYAETGDTNVHRFATWSKRLLKQSLHGRFHFYCLNKALAMQCFLELHSDLDDKARFIWTDPDMVFNKPWDPPASMVRPGYVAGQHWWGHDQVWCQKNVGCGDESLCPPCGAAIMFPFCITVGDMRAIVALYGRFSAKIYDRTRDWQSEMYGLVMAMSAVGLECHTIAALGTCNNWPDGIPDDPEAPISHYTQAMQDREGRKAWDKREYTPHTSSMPWQRPPNHSEVVTLTDQRSLRMLHRFIDWQEEKINQQPAAKALRCET